MAYEWSQQRIDEWDIVDTINGYPPLTGPDPFIVDRAAELFLIGARTGKNL